MYQPCHAECHLAQWRYRKCAYPRGRPRHWEDHPECRCHCPGSKLARDLHVDYDPRSGWFPVENSPRAMNLVHGIWPVHTVQINCPIKAIGPVLYLCLREVLTDVRKYSIFAQADTLLSYRRKIDPARMIYHLTEQPWFTRPTKVSQT